jgi:hypothetical protein
LEAATAQIAMKHRGETPLCTLLSLFVEEAGCRSRTVVAFAASITRAGIR